AAAGRARGGVAGAAAADALLPARLAGRRIDGDGLAADGLDQRRVAVGARRGLALRTVAARAERRRVLRAAVGDVDVALRVVVAAAGDARIGAAAVAEAAL